MRVWTTAVLAGILLLTACSGAFATPTIVVREERTVVVNGVTETWQLVWIGRPKEFCPATDIEMAITCPCGGVAYGEYGNLWLIRKRHGREVDRMDLRPLFNDTGFAYEDELRGNAFLQRYPMQDSDWENKDITIALDRAQIAAIKRRPAPVIMAFADYDHDGQASEFLLQVGTRPCDKLQYVAVGVSARNPHLHAFASAEASSRPLVMPAAPWRALLRSPRPSKVVIWECADHGSEVHSDLIVSAKSGTIHEKERDTPCTTEQVKQGGYNSTPQ